MSELSKRHDGLAIKVLESEQLPQDGIVNQLFEIISPNEHASIVEELRKHPTLVDVSIISSKNGRIFGIARSNCHRGCGLAENVSCILRRATSGPNGEVYWHLVGSDSARRAFMKRLDDRGIPYRVAETQILKGNGVLTSRQELVVKAALDLGYFDYPKRIASRELASLLGVSPATVTETLRKGLKKILKEYFSSLGDIELREEYDKKMNSWPLLFEK